MLLAGLAVILVLAIAGTAIGLANHLVRLRNRVDYTWSDVDALLARRAGAIPRLVAVMQASQDHERAVLAQVAEARAAVEAAGAGPTRERMAAEASMGSASRRLVAVAEGYPALRAIAQAEELIAALKAVEGDLAKARLVYNRCVRTYEDARQRVPFVLVAGPLGFGPRTYFADGDA